MKLEDLRLVRDLYGELEEELYQKSRIIIQVYLHEWARYFHFERFKIEKESIEMTFECYGANDFDITISFEDATKDNDQFEADLVKRKEREDEEKRIRSENRKLEGKKMLEEALEHRDQEEYKRLKEKYGN